MLSKSSKLHFVITVLVSVWLASCGDSAIVSTFDSPPIGDPIERPVVLDGLLFDYNPTNSEDNSEGFLERIVTPTDGSRMDLFVYLDTDSYEPRNINVNGNAVDFRGKDKRPDYIAYSAANILYLLDMQTRHSSELLDFDSNENPNGPEIICDIQGFLLVDEANVRATSIAPVIHAEQVNVQAVPRSLYETSGNDCDTIAPSEKRHYSLSFFESDTQDYRVTKTREDESGNSFFELVTLAELEATKRNISSALMYSGKPLFNQTQTEFGYLGFNSDTSSFEFWSSNTSEPTIDVPTWIVPRVEEKYKEMNEARIEVYRQINNEILSVAIASSQRYFNRSSSPQSDTIKVTLGGDIVSISREDIFSTNLTEGFETNLESPLYGNLLSDPDMLVNESSLQCLGNKNIDTFLETITSPFDTDFTLASGLDENQGRLYCNFSGEREINFVSTGLNENPTEDETGFLREALISGENLLVWKGYSQQISGDQGDFYLGADSLVSIPLGSSNIETTVIPRTNRSILNVTRANVINYFNHVDETIDASFGNVTSVAKNTIGVDYIEARNFPSYPIEPEAQNVLFNGTATRIIDPNAAESSGVLNASANCSPSLSIEFYGCPNGDTISTLDEILLASDKNQMTSITNEFGLAKLKVAELGENNQIQDQFLGLYYFDPIDIAFDLDEDEVAPEHLIKPMELICILEDGNGARLDTSDSRSCYGR